MDKLEKSGMSSFFNRFLMLLAVFLFFVHTSNAQEYKTVKAERGDGIYSLLKRHGLPPSELNNFIELNRSQLGPNNSLIIGRTYRLPNSNLTTAAVPASASTITVPLFGPKYQQVTIKDNQLRGAVYYLISGHGGPDPGAVGHYNNHMLCEDEYAYDVTLRLARNLMEHGATVYMIVQDPNDGIRDESFLKPDQDEVCYPNQPIPRNQVARLRQRKDIVNELYLKHRGSFQRLVEIHVDSRSTGQNIDVFFYHDQRSKTGQKLAMNLHQTFRDKYRQHQPNRGYHGTVSARNLYILKNSYPPAVFIELGNINHHRDQQRLILESNRQALANWLRDGLLTDHKNNR